MASAQQIIHIWRRLSRYPGGHRLFSWILAWKVPYSGSIGARIVTLEPGRSKVTLRDKHGVRNHLNSVHAVALTNLGELASGLALNAGLPATVRGIVTKITTEYFKKARGNLLAESTCSIPEVSGDLDYAVESIIRNSDNEIVARITVDWRLGLRPTDETTP
jgi:acyl-coenzyme A thioesterase PaaI-like protein